MNETDRIRAFVYRHSIDSQKDIKYLLSEIDRLEGLVREAHDIFSQLSYYDDDVLAEEAKVWQHQVDEGGKG